MGIYINMEMPNNCINCAARHGAECWLADCSYIPNYHKERPKWCPLVTLPPHGRLGDLDALKAKAIERSEKCGEMVNVLDKVITVYDISTAPTVIPAEPCKQKGE